MAAGDRRCALAIEHVIETMRALPVQPLGELAPSVLGVSMIRGVPTPVIDLAALFDDPVAVRTRFVTVKAGARAIALACDAVIGIRALPPGSLSELPPMLEATRTRTIEAIGALDAELLMVLRAARLVTDELVRVLDGATPRDPRELA